MRIPRRQLLVGTVSSLGTVGSLGALTACSDDDTGAAPEAPLGSLAVDDAAFAHGVASGDPLADRVILWTRVTTAEPSVTVRWVVASDPSLAQVVARGEAQATEDADWTVKVDATGLVAGTTYYYAFAIGTRGRSVTGRTRTLPKGDLAQLRIAFTSCANYNNGYFNAYARIAERADVDVWLHLGDYIYEYANGVYGKLAAERAYAPPGETLTLADYRKRYAQYRTDPDLRELHRQHPLIVVWDDHEVANDAWKGGAENHQPDEGDWNTRKLAGTRAFVEWLPIRVPVPTTEVPKIWRSFAFGDLADLMMLDTRLVGRDQQVGSNDVVAGGGGANRGTPEQWADPSRELLGAEQEAWLRGELVASKSRGAAWRLLGNQVILSPTVDPRTKAVVSTDFWDGYQATRTRLFDHLVQNDVKNLVVLTGDIHTSWALDTPRDLKTYDPKTGAGAVAVEVVGPAVTSQGLEGDPLAGVAPALLKQSNPHLFYSEVTRKGYVLVDVTKERVQIEWWYVGDHLTRTNVEELAQVFTCAAGVPHLVEGAQASAPKPAPAKAP